MSNTGLFQAVGETPAQANRLVVEHVFGDLFLSDKDIVVNKTSPRLSEDGFWYVYYTLSFKNLKDVNVGDYYSGDTNSALAMYIGSPLRIIKLGGMIFVHENTMWKRTE